MTLDINDPLFVIAAVAFVGWQITRFAFPPEPLSASGSGVGAALGAMFEGTRQAAMFVVWLVPMLVAMVVYLLFFRSAA